MELLLRDGSFNWVVRSVFTGRKFAAAGEISAENLVDYVREFWKFHLIP